MRLIVADVRSTSTDGIAAGHYFTVAQNYLDLFGAEMDVRIAGQFKSIAHDAFVGGVQRRFEGLHQPLESSLYLCLLFVLFGDRDFFLLVLTWGDRLN